MCGQFFKVCILTVFAFARRFGEQQIIGLVKIQAFARNT